MNRRHKFVSILVIVTVMVATAVSVLSNTRMDEHYGMAKIRLGRETVYVKSRNCKAACDAGMWLTRSSDRCLPPDPSTDYRLNDSELLYATEDDKLVLLGAPFSLVKPTGGDWIDARFVSPASAEASRMALRAILIGERLPSRNVPAKTVTLQPCVRAFGHNWNWL